MKSKNFAILIICFFTALALFAQEKVVEKSGKRPDWIGRTMPETIIVSNNSSDLNEAQAKCMEEVKKEIAYSIAVNISTSTNSSVDEITYNEQSSIYSKYSSQTEQIAAELPYINGISIADAETYWEKIYVKKEKRYYYRYHLKYPFLDSFRQKLINEFNKIDSQKIEKLHQLEKAYYNISAIEDIRKHLIELQTLKEYFFDSTRLSEATELEKRFKELYKQITVQEIENIPGKYTFSIMLRNRTVSIANTPRLKSDYATNMSISRDNSNNTFVVKYDYKGCTDEDENTIKVIINTGNGTITHTFRFDISETEPEISIPGFVNIKISDNSIESNTENVEQADYSCTIELSIMTQNKNLKIEGIMLNIGEITESLVSEEFKDNKIVPGNNIYSCKVNGIKIFGEKHNTLTDGYIEIRNNTDNSLKRIRIQRPYKVIR